ncbi:hypothetical protein BGW80DRAFT_1445962 [Lactifluus volemus]|nr:hypothetical protein BGW80DRAFT_1445962 [Lactifluus volemus]
MGRCSFLQQLESLNWQECVGDRAAPLRFFYARPAQGAIEIMPNPTQICHILPPLTFARLGGDIASMLDADAVLGLQRPQHFHMDYDYKTLSGHSAPHHRDWRPLLSLMYTLREGNRFPPPVMVKEKGQTQSQWFKEAAMHQQNKKLLE